MYYQLKKDCYIRKYGEYGYITSSGIYNDQVFNEAGAVFLSALSRQPQSLDELTDKILKSFIDVEKDDIISDVKDFFDTLAEDGFLAAGSTAEECEKNNIGFKYLLAEEVTFIENYTPKIKRSEQNTQNMLQKYFIDNPLLGNFQIELTSKCNERCVHCYIPHEYKTDMFDAETYYKILDELEEMGTLSLTLSGGEPMLHPEFINFLKAAKAKDLKVNVLSNLTLLTDEIIDALKEGSPSSVQVSLYSMVPEHHDAVTKMPGSFEKTKNAILKLIENDVPVQISCPVTKINKDDYQAVYEWAAKHKIRAITDYSIMAKYNHDTSNLDYRLSPEEAKEFMESMIKFDSDYREQLLSSDFEKAIESLTSEKRGEEPFCGIGITNCSMNVQGEIYPCAGWQNMSCGNVKEDSLANIWKNSGQLNYLRSIRKKDIPKCMDCEQRAYCSPCLVRFANESPAGNMLDPAKHFCEVAALNKKVVEDWRAKNNL